MSRLGSVASAAAGALAVVLLAGGGALALAGPLAARTFVWDWALAELTIAAAFCLVGVVLVRRRPHNGVGWLGLGIGVLAAYGFFQARLTSLMATGQAPEFIAVLGLVRLPLPSFMPLLALLLLLFPDGRPSSPMWRLPVVAVAVAGAVGFLADTGVLPAGWYVGVEVIWLAGAPLGVLSLAQRWRRSTGEERQQLKVLTFTIGVAIALFFFGAFTGVAPVTNAIALPLIPAGIALAILRYRLYDIDRLISRTVSYALITGVLVGAYAGGVLLLGWLLAPLASESQVAVAASTLMVAALFRPVRARVQISMDRRFNRIRFDAQREVDAFAARLRDKVDLGELTEELVGVVTRTVQPAQTSLWLRGG